MKKSYVSLLVGSLFIAQYAYADDALRPVLEARYAEAKTAMANNDADAMGKIVANDFTSAAINGETSDKRQMLDLVRQMPKDAKQVSSTTIKSIQQTGDVAVVEQRYQMQSEKPDQTGKISKLQMYSDSTDTWKNTGGVWMLEKTLTNVMDITVDGKPMLHKERGK